MESRFEKLYSAEETASLKKKALGWTLAAVFTGAAALLICVIFCVSAYITESRELFPATVITSIAGGFAVITIVHFPLADVRAAIKHSEAMLEGEAETVEGRFTVTNERLFVRKGVGMVRVKVEGNELVRSVQIWDRKKELFDGSAIRVRTVYGFITEYEVTHEDI